MESSLAFSLWLSLMLLWLLPPALLLMTAIAAKQTVMGNSSVSSSTDFARMSSKEPSSIPCVDSSNAEGQPPRPLQGLRYEGQREHCAAAPAACAEELQLGCHYVLFA